MGSILGYSGLTTKLKAMKAKLLKDEDYRMISEFENAAELIRLLKNLTNNVNQIAKRLNERGSIYETEIDDICQRLDELWDITNQLLAKLGTTHG